MESLNLDFALYGGKNKCPWTVTVFFLIYGVCTRGVNFSPPSPPPFSAIAAFGHPPLFPSFFLMCFSTWPDDVSRQQTL